MSCTLYDQHQSFKLVTLSAVISSLMMSNLYAATIGTSNVKSSQYKPLSAAIEVSDIQNPDNFSVALANRQIYQQMGLTINPTMSVSFVKTSSHSGKIILNTAEPLNEAFADVVLTVNDAGTQAVVPKTLLLPLGGAIQPTLMPTQSTDNQKISASTKSQKTTEITLGQPIIGQPLPISSSLPPPLHISSVTPQMKAEKTVEAQQTTEQQSVISNKTSHIKSMDDIQTLKVNVQRTYHSRINKAQSSHGNRLIAKNTPPPLLNDTAKVNSTNNNLKAASTDKTSNLQAGTTIRTSITKIVPHTKISPQITASSSTSDIGVGTQTYTVQKNDNLWTIANQLAKENNLKIQTVIQHIKTHNPHAFADNDVNRLKIDAVLRLPAYEVIPKDLGISAAIASRKSQLGSDSITTQTQANANTEQEQSVIGPELKKELHDKLHSTRHLTASNGHNVQINRQQVLESTDRMSLQNQRLADLERRLKELDKK